MTTTSNPGSLCITPTLWRQDLLTGDPLNPPKDMRSLSLHAKAGWPHHWFHDRSLHDVLLEIDIRSDSESKWNEERSPGLEGAIGILRYCEMREDLLEEDPVDSFIAGSLFVNDRVFDELWDRVKHRVAFPCEIWVSVFGMTRDPFLAGDDYWDVKSQSSLTVVSVKIRFSTESPNPNPAR